MIYKIKCVFQLIIGYFTQVVCGCILFYIVFTLGKVQSFPTTDSTIGDMNPDLNKNLVPIGKQPVVLPNDHALLLQLPLPFTLKTSLLAMCIYLRALSPSNTKYHDDPSRNKTN